MTSSRAPCLLCRLRISGVLRGWLTLRRNAACFRDHRRPAVLEVRSVVEQSGRPHRLGGGNGIGGAGGMAAQAGGEVGENVHGRASAVSNPGIFSATEGKGDAHDV